MFSEVQRNYVEKLVTTNRAEYPYYIAYTVTDVSNSFNYNDIDLVVILSKKPITASSRYSYDLGDNYIALGVRSRSSSYNYHSERVNNITVNKNLTINNYEFIYTNAKFEAYSLQPDLLSTQYVQQSHFDGFAFVSLILVCTVIFAHIVRGR